MPPLHQGERLHHAQVLLFLECGLNVSKLAHWRCGASTTQRPCMEWHWWTNVLIGYWWAGSFVWGHSYATESFYSSGTKPSSPNKVSEDVSEHPGCAHQSHGPKGQPAAKYKSEHMYRCFGVKRLDLWYVLILQIWVRTTKKNKRAFSFLWETSPLPANSAITPLCKVWNKSGLYHSSQ